MKSVNFVSNIPITKRASIHRWIRISILLIIGTCLLAMVIQIHMYSYCKKLQATSTRLEQSRDRMLEFLQEKRTTKQQQEYLQKQERKIRGMQEKQKKISSLLQSLTQQEDMLIIQQLTAKKRNVIIEVQSNNMQDIFLYTKQLEQHTLFSHVALQSVTSHDGHAQATIYATLA